MRKTLCLITVAALAVSGCATKRYGRLSGLSPTEVSSYTCRELKIEMAKVSQFVDDVDAERDVDLRAAAAFLGDFTIGNQMERREALKSAKRRAADIEQAWNAKGCRAATADAT